MNPTTTILPGSLVIITKRAFSTKSNVPATAIKSICSVEDFLWEGRRHNRYIAGLILRDKAGNKWTAVLDQVASVNPNYEPAGSIIVCTSCGAIVEEERLLAMPGLNTKACPFCRTLECDKS